jgi:hypothetical protein
MPKLPGSSLMRARMVRGAAAGSKFWTVISAIAFARRILKRLSGSNDDVLYRHRLQPGETLVIANQGEGVRVEGAPTGNMEA